MGAALGRRINDVPYMMLTDSLVRTPLRLKKSWDGRWRMAFTMFCLQTLTPLFHDNHLDFLWRTTLPLLSAVC